MALIPLRREPERERNLYIVFHILLFEMYRYFIFNSSYFDIPACLPALAMLTFVSHANKAFLRFDFNLSGRVRESEQEREREREGNESH